MSKVKRPRSNKGLSTRRCSLSRCSGTRRLRLVGRVARDAVREHVGRRGGLKQAPLFQLRNPLKGSPAFSSSRENSWKLLFFSERTRVGFDRRRFARVWCLDGVPVIVALGARYDALLRDLARRLPQEPSETARRLRPRQFACTRHALLPALRSAFSSTKSARARTEKRKATQERLLFFTPAFKASEREARS